MRRRLSVAMLAAASLIALATVTAPVAGAASPVFGGKIDLTFDPVTATNICPFDVTIVSRVVGTFRIVPIPSGYLEEDTWAEQDEFTGPGGTLTSDWYHSRVGGTHDADFNLTSEFATGQLLRVTLPDGTVFKSAGLYEFDLSSDVSFGFVPTHGLSGDVEAFCAALS
jgi:hypothetical protein